METDMDTIVTLMPMGGQGMEPPSARQIYGTEAEAARRWALDVVSETVERKVKGRCWPIPVRDRNEYKQGWLSTHC
jgi:hypothetical protein